MSWRNREIVAPAIGASPASWTLLLLVSSYTKPLIDPRGVISAKLFCNDSPPGGTVMPMIVSSCGAVPPPGMPGVSRPSWKPIGCVSLTK